MKISYLLCFPGLFVCLFKVGSARFVWLFEVGSVLNVGLFKVGSARFV